MAAALTSANEAPSDRDQLFRIIAENSFGRGRVILASGKESDFYFDMKPSMLHPKGASLMARAILERVREAGGDSIGGLEMGAVPITGAVCLHSHDMGSPVHGFFVRKKQKEHGARKRVEGLAPGQSLNGKKVVVIDDVTTSGASTMQAVEACRDEGADIVLALSIVDREDGAAELFASAGIRFEPLFKASEFLERAG
jgi:orotate phosphoribosyltransferase